MKPSLFIVGASIVMGLLLFSMLSCGKKGTGSRAAQESASADSVSPMAESEPEIPGDQPEVDGDGTMSDLLESLQDKSATIDDEYYFVKECYNGTNTHSQLWRARYNLFCAAAAPVDETVAAIKKYRSLTLVARLMTKGKNYFATTTFQLPADREMYWLFLDTLMAYRVRIESTGAWREKFERLLREQEPWLNSNEPYHTAGFPASSDSCMLRSSNREHSLESWFYGFWLRRYREGTYEIAGQIARWARNMLTNNNQANDSIDFTKFAPEGDTGATKIPQQIPLIVNQCDSLEQKYHTNDSARWDGPLYPGYRKFDENDGSIIINQECRPGDDYAALHQWADTGFYHAGYGLRPGMELTVIDVASRLRRARLTELTCTEGECHGNWWLAGLKFLDRQPEDDLPAINENGGPRITCFTAFPESVVSSGDKLFPLHTLTDSSGCKTGDTIPVPVDSAMTSCRVYRADEPLDITIHLFRYEKGSDEDWSHGPNFVRVKHGKSASFGPWIKVSSWGTGYLPSFAIVHAGDTLIHFAASEGISGPANELRMLAQLRGNQLQPGRSFSAGGQPCD